MPRRDVRIGGDANSAVIATGDGNVIHHDVIADPSAAQDLLAQIQRGEVQPTELAKVDPLPHSTLRLRADEGEGGGDGRMLTPLVPPVSQDKAEVDSRDPSD